MPINADKIMANTAFWYGENDQFEYIQNRAHFLGIFPFRASLNERGPLVLRTFMHIYGHKYDFAAVPALSNRAHCAEVHINSGLLDLLEPHWVGE